ncbi:pyridoxal-phosphate dependent enzyme [Fluviispira sanaruensis]|uniref:Cysteine synthase n=1 Tax=Fluviispira sanaruensis TaxID=2493639 RepID=A0A4P2VSP0_FLUSA|nr:pyridoxal-phosphate dependent enzyme [Fluviispira sanaruensis]BBH51842.1 cysteine synthase [Fluviispira sanaruensis]
MSVAQALQIDCLNVGSENNFKNFHLYNHGKIYKSYSDSILLPNIIQIEKNLFMASFQLMKLMPAKYVIEKALAEKRINPKYPIIETSSGTYALGLGIICAEMGLPFHIISDQAIDDDLKRRLEDLGGYVQILSQTLSSENPQIFRLNTLKEYLTNNPQSFWPQQYNNPENQIAYTIFAEYLIEQLGNNLTLVGSVGSGGSTCGTIKCLRENNPFNRLVGVDTFGSVLFGLINEKRILRGLGNSLMPQNLEHCLFDEVHWVSACDAYLQTRKLHSLYSSFHGPTSGAAYHVAKWISHQNKDEKVVFIAPDTGHRYLSSVYNNQYLKEMSFFNKEISSSPLKVMDPSEVNNKWTYLNWNRRTYKEIMEVKNGN